MPFGINQAGASRSQTLFVVFDRSDRRETLIPTTLAEAANESGCPDKNKQPSLSSRSHHVVLGPVPSGQNEFCLTFPHILSNADQRTFFRLTSIMLQLKPIFTIDVCGYAIMSNRHTSFCESGLILFKTARTTKSLCAGTGFIRLAIR
jgi:hypothetical protein